MTKDKINQENIYNLSQTELEKIVRHAIEHTLCVALQAHVNVQQMWFDKIGTDENVVRIINEATEEVESLPDDVTLLASAFNRLREIERLANILMTNSKMKCHDDCYAVKQQDLENLDHALRNYKEGN